LLAYCVLPHTIKQCRGTNDVEQARLRDNRYRAMEPVRALISQHPPDLGLVIAGRAHFFDTDGERRAALGLGQNFSELSLNEFSDEQLQEYLKLRGVSGAVPS